MTCRNRRRVQFPPQIIHLIGNAALRDVRGSLLFDEPDGSKVGLIINDEYPFAFQFWVRCREQLDEPPHVVVLLLGDDDEFLFGQLPRRERRYFENVENLKLVILAKLSELTRNARYGLVAECLGTFGQDHSHIVALVERQGDNAEEGARFARLDLAEQHPRVARGGLAGEQFIDALPDTGVVLGRIGIAAVRALGFQPIVESRRNRHPQTSRASMTLNTLRTSSP